MFINFCYTLHGFAFVEDIKLATNNFDFFMGELYIIINQYTSQDVTVYIYINCIH